MDLIQRIKMETQCIHHQIENNSLFTKIITKEITLPEYVNLLQILYDFISPYEYSIIKKHPNLISGREKIPLLRADLLQIGQSDQYKKNNYIPEICNKAIAFGYLYIIEGSTLGGQVLSKSLKQNNKLFTDITINYFNSYGADTRRKWNEFLAILLNQNFSPSQEETMIETTSIIFKKLYYLVRI